MTAPKAGDTRGDTFVKLATYLKDLMKDNYTGQVKIDFFKGNVSRAVNSQTVIFLDENPL